MDGHVGDNFVVPDLVGAVGGYKVIQLSREGALTSPYYGAQKWTKNYATAKCLSHNWGRGYAQKPKHDSPSLNCKCGLYSYHEADEVTRRYSPIYNGVALVCLTSNTGKIMVHPRGIRSAEQRIEAWAYHDNKYMAPNAAEWRSQADFYLDVYSAEWGIPLLADWRDLPDVATDMGLHPTPDSLRPS